MREKCVPFHLILRYWRPVYRKHAYNTQCMAYMNESEPMWTKFSAHTLRTHTHAHTGFANKKYGLCDKCFFFFLYFHYDCCSRRESLSLYVPVHHLSFRSWFLVEKPIHTHTNTRTPERVHKYVPKKKKEKKPREETKQKSYRQISW